MRMGLLEELLVAMSLTTPWRAGVDKGTCQQESTIAATITRNDGKFPALVDVEQAHAALGKRADWPASRLECSKSNRGHEAFKVRTSNLWWRWSMSRSSACSAGEEGGQAASASSSSSLGAHSSQRS